MAPADDEPGHFPQKVRLILEEIKMLRRLAGQHLGLGAGAIGAQDRDEGGLAGRLVGADGLADRRRKGGDLREAVLATEIKAETVAAAP